MGHKDKQGAGVISDPGKQRRCTRITVSEMLTLPKNKPACEQILRFGTQPIISKVDFLEKKAVFMGCVQIDFEYVADLPEGTQPVYFASFKQPFAGFIDDLEAHADQQAKLDTSIEYQGFEVESGRSVVVAVLVKVSFNGSDLRPAVHPVESGHLPHQASPHRSKANDSDHSLQWPIGEDCLFNHGDSALEFQSGCALNTRLPVRRRGYSQGGITRVGSVHDPKQYEV